MIKIKSKNEIAKIKESGLILREVANKAIDFIRVGITTSEIDLFIEEEIRKAGCIPTFKGYKGFPRSSCISINEELIHGIPGPRIVENGDIISIDIGVTRRKMISDSCFTVGVGTITQEDRTLIETAQEATLYGISICKPGLRISQLGKQIANFLEDRGYLSIPEFCGHGTGRELHEGPQIIFSKNFPPHLLDPMLRPGMVITVEPVVCKDNNFIEINNKWTCISKENYKGAQFEHTIAITNSGCEILTGKFGKLYI